MKKVIYLAFNISHGKGGHFYSLRTTAEALKGEDVLPLLVTIGVKDSPVFKESKVEKQFIFFNGLNLLSTFNKLKKIIATYEPDLIHAFDLHALFFGRIMAIKFSLPLIVTKCGGKNLRYTPFAKNFILYSEENLTYLKKQKKFNNTGFSLIPNRVDGVSCDIVRIDNLRNLYNIDSSKKTFLRISRFVSVYEESMVQAINLTKYFAEKGLGVQLIILGEIQEEKSYQRIKEYSENIENIVLITNPKFTSNASNLIDIADCVIGTGRGLMEAASCGKILFTPLKNFDYPAFVDETNVSSFLKTNFSPRNKLNKKEMELGLEKSITIIGNPLNSKEYNIFSQKVFFDFFDIKSSLNKYKNIYDHLKYISDKKYFDLLLHFFYLLRFYYTSKRKFK